jgi:hypothetical protein
LIALSCAVLADARAQAELSLNAQRNLIIVRLACS